MADSPLKIGFNVAFAEAINAAKQRGVVLPEKYYGELQGIARQLAFSVAGLSSLDQIQQVKDSLDEAAKNGESFNSWRKRVTGTGLLDLPKHRLDNIFRTNLQGQYMAGKWEKFERNKSTRPYLMYDAINDSRVRPAHLAMDGIIRRIDDSFWATHSAPNGYRCRCSLISLTQAQAQARSNGDNGLNKQATLPDGTPAKPDKGWEYNPKDRLAGVKAAIKTREGKASTVLVKALDAKLSSMKPLEIVPAKTAREAGKWAVDNNLVDYADFGAIKVEVANDMNQSLLEHINEFPKLRTAQKFIGTGQLQFTYWQTKASRPYIARLIEKGYTPEQAKEAANKLYKKPKMKGTTWMHSWAQPEVSGTAVNDKWGKDLAGFAQSLNLMEDTKYHPIGCNTVKSVTDHEFGHQLDDLLGFSKNHATADGKIIRHEIRVLYTEALGAGIKENLSEYAGKNFQEFVAEAWSEAKNNPNPRYYATEVARIIRDEYKKQFPS